MIEPRVRGLLTLAVVVVSAAFWIANATAGPVILGGDDLTDHGSFGSMLPPPVNTVAESEPNDDSGTADPIAIGDDYTASISPASESDFISFSGVAGQEITAATILQTLGDSTLRLLDVDGVTELAFNDDFNGLQSRIDFVLPADGTYFLQVQSFGGGSFGSYTLQLGDSTTLVDAVFEGWLYIRRALENLAPAVTVANDGSVAVLGSADSRVTEADAGAAYHFAVPLAAASTSLSGVVAFRFAEPAPSREAPWT